MASAATVIPNVLLYTIFGKVENHLPWATTNVNTIKSKITCHRRLPPGALWKG